MTDPHEGQPGEPGEAGTDGGGAGGTGGRGGRGGDSNERRLIWALAFFIVVAIALSVGTLLIAHDAQQNSNRVEANTDAITKLEAHDTAAAKALLVALQRSDTEQAQAIKLIRQAEFRICTRQMVNRVALNLDRLHDEPTLRILDCKPNLVGKVATLATPAEVRALEQTVRNGTAP